MPRSKRPSVTASSRPMRGRSLRADNLADADPVSADLPACDLPPTDAPAPEDPPIPYAALPEPERSVEQPRTANAAMDLPSLLLPDGIFQITPEPIDVTEEARVVTFDPIRALRGEAMQWAWTVRNRRRWADEATRVKAAGGDALEFLQSVLEPAALEQLANADLAQISVPHSATGSNIESHIMPWEFVLTAATRDRRGGRSLVVCRQLAIPGRTTPVPQRQPRSVLYVESQPGRLLDTFSFVGERSLVKTTLCDSGAPVEWHELLQPTPASLREAVHRIKPDIVHFAGFDAHQGRKLLEYAGEENLPPLPLEDGYLVQSDDSRAVVCVDSLQLAAMFRSAPSQPLLVSLSLWNSASRVAPALIAAGVDAVLSFQDSYRDEHVEELFADFYRCFQRSAWQLRGAFHETIRKLQREPSGSIGSGVVLWSAAALVGTTLPPPPAPVLPAAASTSANKGAIVAPLDPALVSSGDLGSYIQIEVRPFEELNYARLHNKKALFRNFKLMRLKQHQFADIHITVDLHVGEATVPWRSTVTLDKDTLDLAERIQIAQTAALLRSAREAVNSLLFVEVAWGKRILLRESFSVSLPPVDQWRDMDPDRWWLPCFILPRDSCVGALMSTAQNYVRVLRDDPGAGFDGYQAIDSLRDDPCEDVDLQAQAIWCAVLHEWRLSYINPPPSYGEQMLVQRLRSPSLIYRYRAGTCIDLALLLAACLESVDIYPVVFLSHAHAFVGYWRSPEGRERFFSARPQGGDDMDTRHFEVTAPATVQAEPWVSGRPAYWEIVRSVEDGDLVVIEATALTANCGFWAAVESGQRNLDNAETFDLMIDVASARAKGIRPLPVTGEAL